MERFPADEFAIFGINTDSDPARTKKQYQEFGVSWTNLFDGSTRGPVTQAWGVMGFPTMYVLDGHGVIRAVDARGDTLERVVELLVEELRASQVE